MFCSECGKPVHGKFCSDCGVPLEAALPVLEFSTDLTGNWEHELHYETILKFPDVRATIERHASRAKKKLTGEQYLAMADKLVPMGVSMEGLAAVIQPLYAKLGIKTGKERVQHMHAPVGKVLVRALCSLARNGQALQGVTQAADGCLLRATLPSDLFSLEGELHVNIRRHGQQVEVSGATHIGGQLFDWGKSTRCLDRLFTDVTCDAA